MRNGPPLPGNIAMLISMLLRLLLAGFAMRGSFVKLLMQSASNLAMRLQEFVILTLANTGVAYPKRPEFFPAPASQLVKPMRATCKRISCNQPMGSQPLQRLFEEHRADPAVASALMACATRRKVLPRLTFLGRRGPGMEPGWEEFVWPWSSGNGVNKRLFRSHEALGLMTHDRVIWANHEAPAVRSRRAHLLLESWTRTLFGDFLEQHFAMPFSFSRSPFRGVTPPDSILRTPYLRDANLN